MKTNKSRIVKVVITVFLLVSLAQAYKGKWIGPLLHAPSMNRLLQKSVVSTMMAIMVASGSATASSGGGLDYANANLKDQGMMDSMAIIP